MTIFEGILLGLIQGLGEFLPISSSAHLILLPNLLGKQEHDLTIDVMLHAATLLAVLLYFWKDWWVLIKNGLTRPNSREGKMLWYLAAATIPAAAAGFLFKQSIEHTLRNPLFSAGNLILFAIPLWLADHYAKESHKTEIFEVPFKTIFWIGCAQALAIMPGVSRSGITITAALFLGLSRSVSTRISFLLSTPIIAGASLLKAGDLSVADLNAALFWGCFTAFVSGLLVISGLMKFIKTHHFDVFVYYRVILGLLIISLYFLK